jgi:hypothetical protein
MGPNCTRRPTLIGPTQWLVWLTVLLLCPAASAQQPAQSDAVACVSCVILHVPVTATATLSQLPAGALDGLTIVADATAAANDRLVVDRIRATGANAGLVLSVTGVTESYAEFGAAAVLILTGVGDSDEDIFQARTLVTALRAVAPGVRIVIAAQAVPQRLSGYVDGRVEPVPRLSGATADALTDVSLKGGSDPLLVRIDEVDPQVLVAFAAQRALAAEVTADAALTVQEIVARHQAQRRRQEQLVQRTIARGTTSLMFEVPGFVAPVAITAQTTMYVEPGVTELEQRDIRVNGAAIAGGNASSPPQLPLIEPERVATPPLAITLDETYRYSLTGREPIDGAATYVVAFAGPGVRGRAWIDAATFALRRLETVQGRLKGAIVSSEQHEQFAPFPVEGESVWLPVRTNVFQMYEGAGHRTPIHRVIETPAYDINPADFDAQLQAAHASPNLMLRETPQGFRYLLRERTSTETARDTATARVIAPRAGERIRAVVFGLLVDPNITVPLPFAGVSYVDLNLFDTGAQLNAFFGGTYGQLSWSVPSMGGTRWQAHGRVFAIAAKFNDRSVHQGVEQYDENITQRPAHLSAGILGQLSTRMRMRLAYELDYSAFDRSDTTAATFVVPVDAVVHGLMAAIETESGPWSARAWWNPARRQRWQAWGDVERNDENTADAATDARAIDARTFQRFGVLLARTLALGRTFGSRIEIAWMDGADLDRFSRYSFNAFENRLHGYPTASIRYDRGGVARSATSWSGRGWRLDGFVDVAVASDPGFGDALRGYPGLGAAIETAGPLRTLWALNWGYGLKARRSDGGMGTHALRITGFRTF